MQVTFIIRDKSDSFYDSLAAMSDADRHAYLVKNSLGLYVMPGLSMKIGTGQFRDRMELNQLQRGPVRIVYKLESRKGYKLATFTFSAASFSLSPVAAFQGEQSLA